MSNKQKSMVISWVVATTLFILLLLNYSNYAVQLFIIAVGGSIYYFVRSDIENIKYRPFQEMGTKMKLFSIIHYSIFALVSLYLSLYNPELFNYDFSEFIVFLVIIFAPILPIAIKKELELFKSYGKNA